MGGMADVLMEPLGRCADSDTHYFLFIYVKENILAFSKSEERLV